MALQVLLGLVLDIKNNRQRSQGTGGPLTISSVLSAGLLKWLKGCGTGEFQLRNLPWQLVLQANKKVRLHHTCVPLCKGAALCPGSRCCPPALHHAL